MEKILFFTNCQKILSFLIKNIEKEYYDFEISKLAGVSRAGANFALRDLARAGIITRSKRGRMFFYKALRDTMLIKYLKIVQNIASLNALIEKLKNISLRIILYGSAAQGENAGDADLDVFILTRNKDEVKHIIFKDKLRERIQQIIMNANEHIKLKRQNPVFYNELEQGIELWKMK